MGDGSGGVQVPLSRLGVTAAALEAVGEALDRLGSAGADPGPDPGGEPGGDLGGDLGDAAAVVAVALAAATEGAALLAAEAHAIAAAVSLTREDMAATDAQAVVDLFRVEP